MQKYQLFRIVTIISLVITSVNCMSVLSYSGDGQLIDNGPLAATDRYVLDLGEITLDDGKWPDKCYAIRV